MIILTDYSADSRTDFIPQDSPQYVDRERVEITMKIVATGAGAHAFASRVCALVGHAVDVVGADE